MNRLVILNFGAAFCFCLIFSFLTTGSRGEPLGQCGEDHFNGTYNITDSQQCDKFYVCSGSNVTDSFCDDGLRFSNENKRCEEAKRVNCSGRILSHRDILDPTNCTLESGNFRCTYGKECIRLDQLCDGNFDCLDASDEFENCGSVCTDRSICDQVCVPTPATKSSPPGTCLCSKGYKVNPSKKSACIDVDECAIFGSCSQHCENLNGSFKCGCMEGFVVDAKNNQSCTLKDPTWKLIYATRSEVAYISSSSDGRERKYRVTPDDGRPVGVTYDVRNNAMYWTDVSSYSEAIYKATLQGDMPIEVIADTGLLLPEGISFDWITGNIYFADSNLSHIGVCRNDSNLCSILIEESLLEKPRDIALHPNLGIMFWTDWGSTPMIMSAGMDGRVPNPIITVDLKWPNGITIDYGNSRIYWVDAGMDRIESSRLDGSDRQPVILKNTKHPFSVDILGDRLYWSDWSSMEIKSVDKFTGQNGKVHMYDPHITTNGVALFHVANQPIQRSNPCLTAKCSHICVLSPITTFRCLCPVGMTLENDQKTCSEIKNLPKLVIAFKGTIKILRLNSIGKNVLESITLPSIKSISAVVYNPINHTIILSDSASKKIYEYSINRKRLNILIEQHLDSVKALEIDVVGENLYWVDGGKQTLEVMSFRTRARTVLMTGIANPYDILIVPETRSLYLARMGRRGGKIYKMMLNGDNSTVLQKLGDKEPVALAYDDQFGEIIWADKVYRGIESVRPDGRTGSVIASKQDGPPSDVVKFGNQVYWTDMFTQSLKTLALGFPLARLIRLGSFEGNSSSSNNNTNFYAKLAIINRDMSNVEVLRNKHECSFKNGNKNGCSHLCLLVGDDFTGVCRCPDGLILDEDGKTCIKMSTCADDQFTCSDGNCISRHYICDGIADCSHNDDEVNCYAASCSEENFKCESNGVCIPIHWVCDGERDCVDGGDEKNCTYIPCNEDFEFRCESTGRCIPKSWRCDHAFDCPGDDSDERQCNFSCPDGFFQCSTSLHCIMGEWVCDGDADCEDGSDEAVNCAERSCLSHQFMCNSGKCIEKSLVCDGHTNCAQREDEENCQGFNHLEVDPSLRVIPVTESKDESGTGATVAIVIGVIAIMILVGIVIAIVLTKRNIQPKVLIRPYVHGWNKYVHEPVTRLFAGGRGEKLDCEQNVYYSEVYGGSSSSTSYYSNAAVYEEVDGSKDIELQGVGSKSEKDAAARSFADSGIISSERESLYDETEDCGSHYVSYSQKDKLIN